MQHFDLVVGHRPELDGTVAVDTHVRFYEALEAVASTWMALLAGAGRADLAPAHFAVVNVIADFRREMFVGELAIDIAVEKVGSSSVTFGCALSQGGTDTGTVRAVMVQVGEGRLAAVSFSDEQRAALENLQST